MPKLSIVIVNYNSGEQLSNCLRMLDQQTYQDFDVWVIDNASKDGSCQAAKQLILLCRVNWIMNEKNLGFAAGQNQGIRSSDSEFVLSLNYDLTAPPCFLERFVTAIENTESDVGWGCCKMLNMLPGGEIVSSLYAVGHHLPDNRFPLLKGNNEVDMGQYDSQQMVFGAPGAAALYKRSFIEDISVDGKFFDERFFTWCEDVDVDWRGQNRGWRCVYVPSAVVYHQGHVGEVYSEPFRSFRAEITIRNRWLMILKNENNPQWRALIKYEISLLIYVLRENLILAYFKAVFSFLHLFSSVLKDRRHGK